MQRHIRKIAWLGLASLLALSLPVGAVLSHEGRPLGDYRLIVGWLEEPAYEGARNAVSIRVNKIVEGTPEDAGHGPPGHHEEDPAPTPATSGKDAEPGESQDRHGDDGHSHNDGGEHSHNDDDEHSHNDGGEHSHNDDEHSHNDGGEHSHNGSDEHSHNGDSMAHFANGNHGSIESESAMSVEVEAAVDAVSGVNVQIIPSGFTFAPEKVNQEHADGEGHAHIYVDGVKLSRVYTPWLHIDGLEPGVREIRVTLNANSHSDYTWNGEAVEATTSITVPEPGESMHSHKPATVEAEAAMSISIRVEPDPLGGANLFITRIEGFTFSPKNASGDHVADQGNARVYVNGVKVARLYGNAYQLGRMAEGLNTVRVTLNANDHSAYTWNGQPVEAVSDIEIARGMGGAGYGKEAASQDQHNGNTDAAGDESEGEHTHNGDTHTHNGTGHNGTGEEDTSRLILPQGSAKPMASIAGQHDEQAVPVEGLEETLQVEVIHVGSGAARVQRLEAAYGDPGHYVAALIPTAAGVYEFRLFGSIEGMAIDETFISMGGGGDFDDVQTSANLQFPEQLPEIREISGAVQGARDIAQQAQDIALAAQASDSEQGGNGNMLAIAALAAGIVGAVLGASGIFFALRVRQSRNAG